MGRRVLVASLFAISFLGVQFGLVGVGSGQWAANTSNDLFGENRGDFIMLQWTRQNSAEQYLVYTAGSSDGPWEQLFGVSDMSGGAKIHRTPKARVRDVCYKVEAQDASGMVI